jgi:hypothetical protein
MAMVWLALAAAAPAAFAQRGEARGTAEPLWDRYPLDGQRGTPAAAATQPATLEEPAGGSDGTEEAALLISLALLGGGAAGWVLSLRRPIARRRGPAKAAPLDAAVRPAEPRLWGPGAAAAEPEPAPELAVPTPPPGGPEPPEPGRAWAAAIEWHLVDGGSQFRVMGRPAEGDDDAIALGASPVMDWPPAGPQSVQALADAVKRLETRLVAAGWTPLERGTAWYAKRFTWQPGARPPATPTAPARMRHRSLYDSEYGRQVDRTLRMRQEIAARVLPPDRQDLPMGAAPEWEEQRS